jgi:hypothetical protein
MLAINLRREGVAGPEAASSPKPPGTGENSAAMMIATIQPRHERLWRAEQDGNWEFAAYELGNLQGAFNRFGRAHPTEHDVSLPEMIASVTGQPFNELKSAIQAKDVTAFAKAYANLTDACNSCHQALNHGVVEISVPRRTSVGFEHQQHAPEYVGHASNSYARSARHSEIRGSR